MNHQSPGSDVSPGVAERDPTTLRSRDILANRWLSCALYCLPAVAIAVTASPDVAAGWRTVVWTVALGIMGTACVANAIRCGRVHCYLTGPFFLAMAIATLLYGVGALPLGANGWNLIGLTILVGAIALYYVPELLLGKYRQGRAGDGGPC